MAEPMYRLIADDLRSQIESGALAPGAQLMSEVELREHYGQGTDEKASRNTVRDAIKLLTTRGLVEVRPGQGTFVVKKVLPFISKLNMDPKFGGIEDEVYKLEAGQQGRNLEETRPRVEVMAPTDFVARHLQLDEGAQVISRYQERRIDGSPWSLQTTFYPMQFFTRGATRLLMAEKISEGMVRYLEAELGIKQAGWRDTILARSPNEYERVFFELSEKVHVAIFEFQRTAFDEDQTPIRFTVTVHPADRNQFQMESGAIPPYRIL